ncbi:hypothetical protein KSP40_PGU001176 [Platanthera guangdongensis]|uniref:Uncharacterized protein n=1 Tax=Platanthera guangdongensis TaxID=2320717 RepID=A0ABR2M963_9ASPA
MCHCIPGAAPLLVDWSCSVVNALVGFEKCGMEPENMILKKTENGGSWTSIAETAGLGRCVETRTWPTVGAPKEVVACSDETGNEGW